MSKLVRLFEGYSTTQVHGFDWFKGMRPDTKNDDINQLGKYSCDYEKIKKLIDLQKLNDIAIIHKLDLTKDLDLFFEQKSYIRFKLIFVDCGIKKVLEKTLEHFWPKLVYGGVLVMDHYNAEVSPSESGIIESFVGKNRIRHMPFNRQPTCYVVREF